LGPVLAGATVDCQPTIVAFLLQRYLVSRLLQGSLKE